MAKAARPGTLGRPPIANPRATRMVIRLTPAERQALDIVRRARNLPSASAVIRLMSVDEAVREAERLRKELVVAT